MNAITIEVLLHHFHRCDPYPITSPAIEEAHQRLLDNELVEESLGDRVNREHGASGFKFTVTEKGRVYVNALMTVPLPVQAWRMPISDERKT